MREHAGKMELFFWASSDMFRIISRLRLLNRCEYVPGSLTAVPVISESRSSTSSRSLFIAETDLCAVSAVGSRFSVRVVGGSGESPGVERRL